MRFVPLAALAAWLFAAPVAAQTLRVGLASEPTSIDPHFGNISSNLGFARHLFGTLVINDEKLMPRPSLAERWEIRDDLTWVFHLRRNVVFSDGAPFTADDVIYSFCRILPLPTANFTQSIRTFDSIETPDPFTLVIKTKAPNPLLINDMVDVNIISSGLSAHGKIVFDPPNGCGVTGAWPSQADFSSGKAVIGTGPYVLKSYIRGGSVELERNPRYWGPPAPWPNVRFNPVSSAGPRSAGLLAGDFDLIENPAGTDLPRLREDKRFRVEITPTPRLIYLQPDVGREPTPFVDAGGKNPLRDPRVRRAIAVAIDRKALTERIMDGAAVPANQFLPDGMFGALEHPPQIPYDPALAKKLLAEAGYKDGFAMTFHASNDRYINDAKIAQAVGQYLARIGIRADVSTMPVSIYFTQRRELKFSFTMGGWNASSGEATSFLRNWSLTRSESEGLGMSNYGMFSDSVLDDLVRQALHTMDEGARKGLLEKATARAVDVLPEIPLYFESSSWAYRAGLGFKGRPDQFTLAMEVQPEAKTGR